MTSPAIRAVNCHPARGVDTSRVRRIARLALGRLGKGRGAGITVVFLDDAAIRRLNKRFKRHDRPTDVLAFPLGKAGGRGVLAEIYISIDRAIDQAGSFGAGRGEELARYVVHGLLHLYGYDDLTRRERARMSAEEDRILQWIARKEDLSKVLTRR